MLVNCKKSPSSCVMNGTFKNLLCAFVFGGCSVFVVRQAELHLIQRVGQQLGTMKAVERDLSGRC